MPAASSQLSVSHRAIDAVVRRQPITGGVERVSMPEGSTLGDIVSVAFPNPEHRGFAVVLLNGEEIAMPMWDIVPKAGDTVALAFRPAGKDFFRTLLQIAVIAVATWVTMGAGGLFVAGSWQAAVAAAGVSILGNLAINALIPINQPRAPDAPPPYYSLSGARNMARPFDTVPMLFGTHRIVPPRMSEPVQEVIGGLTYLRFALCLGLCPMQVTDWKIGETALSSYSGVEMEVRLTEDAPPHTLLTGDPSQESVGATLNNTEWVTRTTAADVDEIEAIFDFPSGVGGYDSKNRKTSRSVGLLIQYRPTGSSEPWVDLRPGVPDANLAAINAGVAWRGTLLDYLGDLIDYTAELEGLGYTGGEAWSVTRADPGRGFRDVARWAVPRGQYDVRVMRASAASTEPSIFDAAVWSVLSSVKSQVNPFPNPKLATAVFRIKATDQLAGMVDTVNCIASSLQPVFSTEALADPAIADADEFTDEDASSNPAHLALLAARGPNTAYPKPDAEIDWPAWADAAAWFAAQGLTFNEYVEGKIGRWEMVSRILAAGHARPVKHNGKLSVVVDRSRAGEAPAQVFSPRNVRNFRWRKTYPRLPHALRVAFANAANNWQADEVTVYLPGQSLETATRFETLPMPGKTDEDEIRTVANQYARNAYFQTESFEFETDAEHLASKRGDYVVIQHFAMATGLGVGRVVARETDGEGDVTAIVLDAPVDTPESGALALQWRAIVVESGHARMEVMGEQTVTRDAEDPRRFVFATPLDPAAAPAVPAGDYEGDVALVGLAGKVSIEALIADIEPRAHLQAAIRCVAYAGERFVDAPDWPAHDPKVTLPYAPRPTAPVAGTPSPRALEIAVPFTQPEMPHGVRLTGYVIAWREHGETSDTWEPLGGLGPDERIAITPAGDPGASYDVRIVATGIREDGVTVYSDPLIVADIEAAVAPVAPAGCGASFSTRTSSGGAQQLVLTATWTPNEDTGVLDTVIEQRVSTGPDVWQEIGRGRAAAGKTEIHGLPVGRNYDLGFVNLSRRGAPSTRTTIATVSAPDTLVATGAIGAAPGGALDGLLDDIDSALAAAAVAISDAEDRLDDAEDELGLQGTAIGSLETITDGHATSITGLQAKTTINANLLPNSTGAGGLEGWTNPGAWQVYEHELWGPWFNRLFTGASAFTEYFYNSDEIEVFASTQYTVSFSPFLSGLDGGSVVFYVVYYNSGGDYVGEGGNLVLTADSTSGDRYTATFTTSATTAKVRFAVAMVNAVGDPTYAHVGFWQAKIERGATATVWSDDGTLQDARARITTVETVASDNESAIATLDSRLDAAETDIDGVTGDVATLEAANLITRMAAVDGGSASAQTLAQLKAEVRGGLGAGINMMPNSSWQGLFSSTGEFLSTFPSPIDYYFENDPNDRFSAFSIGSSFLPFAKVEGFGGIVIQQTEDGTYGGSHYGGFQSERMPAIAGKRYMSSAFTWGGMSSLYLIFRDAAGSSLGNGANNHSSFPTTQGGGDTLAEWNRWTHAADAPSGTATVEAVIYALGRPGSGTHYSGLMGWMMEELRSGQTTPSPWAPGRNDANYADVVDHAARITEVETVSADNESAIAVIDSRMDAAETDIDGVQSTASNLSTRMAAVDGGSAVSKTQATLEAELVAKTNPGQNLMPYPSGLGDSALASTIGWNVFSAPTPTQALYMPFYAPAGGAFYYSYWSSGYASAGYAYIVYEFPDGAVPGQTYTLSLKGDTNLTAPLFYLGARNASHTDIGASSAGVLSSTRNSVTLVAPANTAYLTLIIELPPQDSSGAYREISFRDIKLEVGAAATVFTDDYGAANVRARVTETEEAIADEVSARAAFQLTAEAEFDDINATVTTQGGAISDIEGGTAWLENVVAAGGGDLGAFRLRAGKAGSFLELVSTVLRLANVSNGDVIEVMRAVGGEAFFSRPLSVDFGGARLTIGPGYGVASSELFLWVGPDTLAPSAQSRTNGAFAIGSDKKLYYGAAELVPPTEDDQVRSGSQTFNNKTTTGSPAFDLATIDLTVGAGGYLELITPRFYGSTGHITQETGMTLSAGSEWFGRLIVTEQLQSGGTEHTLLTLPLHIIDSGGGSFIDSVLDLPVTLIVPQNVSGPCRYRLKIQRVSGSNDIGGNGLRGTFAIRRTP